MNPPLISVSVGLLWGPFCIDPFNTVNDLFDHSILKVIQTSIACIMCPNLQGPIPGAYDDGGGGLEEEKSTLLFLL